MFAKFFSFQPGALSRIRVVDIAVLIRVTAGRQRWRRGFHHGCEARLRLLDAVTVVGVVVIVVLPDSVLNEELGENAVARSFLKVPSYFETIVVWGFRPDVSTEYKEKDQ